MTEVWAACTGKKTLVEIAAATGIEEQVAASAVDQLTTLDLLEVSAGVDRRTFLQRSALAGAGTLTVVAIETVVAPLPQAAATAVGQIVFEPLCDQASGQAGFVLHMRNWTRLTDYAVIVQARPG